MRIHWSNDFIGSLEAEPDKSGSYLFQDKELKNIKPDFLIHKAGDNSNNFMAIEVKPSDAKIASIKSDLNKLSNLKSKAHYSHAICLIYGDNYKEKHGKLLSSLKYLANKQSIEIWVHEEPKSEAIFINKHEFSCI